MFAARHMREVVPGPAEDRTATHVQEGRMSHRIRFAFLFGLPMMMTFCLRPAFAQRPCENLAQLALANATITTATSVPAGTFKLPADPNQLPPRANMPAFCRIAGIAKPTSDSEIKFEVWLPVSGWNGKFEQV